MSKLGFGQGRWQRDSRQALGYTKENHEQPQSDRWQPSRKRAGQKIKKAHAASQDLRVALFICTAWVTGSNLRQDTDLPNLGSKAPFAYSLRVPISFVMTACVCPSVRPHVSTQLPLDRLMWHLTWETYIESWRENTNLIKIWQKYRAFYIRPKHVYVTDSDIKSPLNRPLKVKW